MARDLSEATSLFLDRNGRWFHEGVEITHERTRLLFARSISRGDDGRYFVRVGKESARVEVEDTPFLVLSVAANEDDSGCVREYRLVLNDETEEGLDPSTVTVDRENVMYCRVKGKTERARFTRPAYYQISEYIEQVEEDDEYRLRWKGGSCPIHLMG